VLLHLLVVRLPFQIILIGILQQGEVPDKWIIAPTARLSLLDILATFGKSIGQLGRVVLCAMNGYLRRLDVPVPDINGSG
jgi:hypothetical protein